MRIYFVVKRFFDVLLAFTLLLGLIPIYLLIACIVYLQDFQSAIFKQDRIGRNGKSFSFYKFRSMATSTPNVESRNTELLQVTPFGKFIRRTNLDELPQFYNVLRGDMSFVGPRPPIPTQIELTEMRRSNGALALRPGLTGWAQVNAYNGMSSEEKARYDGEYASKISFMFDLKIIFGTVKYFLKPPPTY